MYIHTCIYVHIYVQCNMYIHIHIHVHVYVHVLQSVPNSPAVFQLVSFAAEKNKVFWRLIGLGTSHDNVDNVVVRSDGSECTTVPIIKNETGLLCMLMREGEGRKKQTRSYKKKDKITQYTQTCIIIYMYMTV